MPSSSRFDDQSAVATGVQTAGNVATEVNIAGPQLPHCVLAAEAGPWALSGCGVFSWSVFRLYKACLFVQGSLDSGRPYALMLSYLRRVTAQQIADTSVQQFERLEFGTEQTREVWSQKLLALLPDVGLGDQLVGVFIPGQKVVFYDGNKLLGSVEDPDFARAFAAIWLDPRTQGQALRKALLGLAND